MNFLDQAAIAALQGLAANGSFLTILTNKYPDKAETQMRVLCATAWEMAESLDKERGDRGHD